MHLPSFTVGALGFLLVLACGPAAPPQPSGSAVGDRSVEETRPRGTLRIAWGPEPAGVDPKLLRAGPADVTEFSAIFSSALTMREPSGSVRPLLARTLPTQANGDLLVNPDGTMVTTYRLRENAKWHDGVALTAHDLVFAARVYSDPEILVSDRSSQNLMSRLEAPDNHTLVIRWRQPYFLAGTLGYRELLPLPRHLLEEKAETDKAGFASGPDWSANFVGNGPFLVERWDLGSGVTARAFVDWFLGPPKIDALDIRFIRDPNTVLANLLSGEVDFTMTDFISNALAVSVREQWVGGGIGYMKSAEIGVQYVHFQFREVPNWQRAVGDVRVRQALMHAIDREGLVEVMTAGLGSPADIFLFPSHPVFREADGAASKYRHDPGRAAQLLSDAGWQRDREGALASNSRGESLGVSYWRSAGGGSDLELSLVVDNWKAVGVDAEGFIIPAPRANDSEFVVSFPGVLASSRPVNPESFVFTSDQRPTAENRWQGINRGSFRDAEVDRLHGLVLTTVDPDQWRQALVGVQKRTSELVGASPLYYRPRTIMARNKLAGVELNPGNQSVTWNMFEWKVTE